MKCFDKSLSGQELLNLNPKYCKKVKLFPINPWHIFDVKGIKINRSVSIWLMFRKCSCTIKSIRLFYQNWAKFWALKM